VLQLLSDTLLPMHSVTNVIGVCRTYPIRVANRYKDGVMVGTSGDCYPDQQEITWESLGREPELTTVNKLTRRIFTFSDQKIAEAVVRNSVNSVFVNFVNYLEEPHIEPFLRRVENALPRGCAIDFVGYGARTDEIEARNFWADAKQAVIDER
jgi:hypothetical protein